MTVPTSNSLIAMRVIPSLSLLLLAAISLLLTSCKPPAAMEPPADPLAYSTPVGDDKITVSLASVLVSRVDDTIELLVTGKFTNNTSEPFETIGSGKFKLINGEGEEIPYFIHPLSEEKFVIEPGTTSYGRVFFRPTLKDFEGPLYLAFNDSKKMIKDRKPIGEDRLPIPSLRNGKKKFIAVDWTKSTSVQLMRVD